MLHSVDKDAGTITLLVPKTIPMARLVESSQKLAKKSAQRRDPEFTLKNVMSDPTFAEWQSATD